MNFITANYGDFTYHRLDFSIDDHDFIMIFSEVLMLESGGTSNFSNEDVGFIIPADTYEVKFDRAENFHNDRFFKLPTSQYSRLNYKGLMRLGCALNLLIMNHESLSKL